MIGIYAHEGSENLVNSSLFAAIGLVLTALMPEAAQTELIEMFPGTFD